jgi:RNA polymerase sigma-70 factor (ECF subfamily)
MNPGDHGSHRPSRTFDELFARYYDRMVRFLISLRFPPEEARDLAQDTFLRVYAHRDQWRGEAEWAYLEAAVRNVASNAIRARLAKKRFAEMASPEMLEVAIDPTVPADVQMSRREQKIARGKALRRAIAGLPRGTRECFILRLEGLPYKEIATRLHISIDAVRSRLYEARQRLTEQLGEAPAGMEKTQPSPEDDHDQ